MSLTADLRAALADEPVAVVLELGTLVVCVLLFVGTFVAFSSGPPTGRGGPWLAVVVVGAAVVLLWTAVIPAFDRLR
ncbi:hypothetical protein [Natronobeatus ordinarius]|uniref:hypothetical protein n=1 Tax=Natronobeatus ordinarius TaxID=2963433 RepID=UPI0020CF9611|nr:hypothetical protein [Natronobeatus ordinarius]